jgi:hypothetical protein
MYSTTTASRCATARPRHSALGLLANINLMFSVEQEFAWFRDDQPRRLKNGAN